MTEMFENTGRRIVLQLMNLSILDFSTANAKKTLNKAVEEVIIEARRKLESNKNFTGRNSHNNESC